MSLERIARRPPPRPRFDPSPPRQNSIVTGLPPFHHDVLGRQNRMVGGADTERAWPNAMDFRFGPGVDWRFAPQSEVLAMLRPSWMVPLVLVLLASASLADSAKTPSPRSMSGADLAAPTPPKTEGLVQPPLQNVLPAVQKGVQPAAGSGGNARPGGAAGPAPHAIQPSDGSVDALRPQLPGGALGERHGDMLRDAEQVRRAKELGDLNEALENEDLQKAIVNPLEDDPRGTGKRPPLGDVTDEPGSGGALEPAFSDPYSTRGGGGSKPGRVVGPPSGDPKDWVGGAAATGGGTTLPKDVIWRQTLENGTQQTVHVVANEDGSGHTTIDSAHTDGTRSEQTTVTRSDRSGYVVSTHYDAEGNITDASRVDAPAPRTGGGADELQGTEGGADANICASMPWLGECGSKKGSSAGPGARPPLEPETGPGPRLTVDPDDLAGNPAREGGASGGSPKLTSPGQIQTGPGAKPLPPGMPAEPGEPSR